MPDIYDAYPALSDLDGVDVEVLSRAIDDGLVSMRLHPEYPRLAVLCYTKRVQEEGLWDARSTMQARGTVIWLPEGTPTTPQPRLAGPCVRVPGGVPATSRVVARGMRKFFTAEAASSDWGSIVLADEEEGTVVDAHAAIDVDARAVVAEKLDGCLAVAYLAPDGRARVCTKGSFSGDECDAANAWLDADGNGGYLTDLVRGLGPGRTLAFEWVGPGAEHVVDYGGERDLALTGMVDTVTARWTPASELREALMEASDAAGAQGFPELAFPIAASTRYHSLRAAMSAPDPGDASEEGFVVTLETEPQQMYKVKFESFLAAQRWRHGRARALRDLLQRMPDAVLDPEVKNPRNRLAACALEELPDAAWAPEAAVRLADEALAGIVDPARGIVADALAFADGHMSELITAANDRDAKRAWVGLVRNAFPDMSSPVPGALLSTPGSVAGSALDRERLIRKSRRGAVKWAVEAYKAKKGGSLT